MSEIKTAEQRIHKLEGADMKTEDVKTWNECVLTPIVKERDELRAALAERDAKLAALEKQEPVAYRFPKAGVDNGYNYCDSLDGEEPRFLKLWEKLYAAAGAAPVTEGWQTIDTAPVGKNKHGYSWMFLAWGPEGDKSTGAGLRVNDKFFAAASYYCPGQEKQFEWREVEVKPSHWMKLPAAPKEPTWPHPTKPC